MSSILYVTYDGLLDAVTQSQVLPYLRGFIKGKVDISVISFEKKSKVKAKNVFSAFRKEFNEYQITWLPLIYHRLPHIPATIYDIAQGLFWGLANNIFRKKIKIIHARGYIAAIIGILLKYATGGKLIFDMRGFWPEEKVDAGEWDRKGIVYSVFKQIEDYLIKKSDKIVVLTETANSCLRSMRSDLPVTVIPCCVDTNLFIPKVSKNIFLNNVAGRFIVIYTGSLGTFYDLKEMAIFFKVFKKKEPRAFFWIVTNSVSDVFRKTVDDCGVDYTDYYISSLGYRDMPCALSVSNVSIMFYRRKLSHPGCSPIKFAESLSCGLPVVINSGIGDTEEIIKKERVGVVVDELSVKSYENKVEEIMKLLSEKDTLSNRCRYAAERYFSLEGGIEKYLQVYQKLLR